MPWTETTRPHDARRGRRSTSDLTDAEWVLVAGFRPPPKQTGRPRTTELRDVLDAILSTAASARSFTRVSDQAREVSPRLKGYSDHVLASVLKSHGCTPERVLRRRGWEFPPLVVLRAAWVARFPGWEWRIPDLDEWGEG